MSSKLFSIITRNKERGISLIEALVATAIVIVLATAVVRGLTVTLFHTQNDFLNMCIWNATTSTLNRIKVNPQLIGRNIDYNCGTQTVITSSRIVSGTLPAQPPASGSNQNSCVIVEVTASYKNQQRAKTQGVVCRFR